MSVGGKALTNAKGAKMSSRGPDELIVVIDDQFEQAPQQTVKRAGAARRKIRFRSAYLRRRFFRSYAQQVGLLVALEHSGD